MNVKQGGWIPVTYRDATEDEQEIYGFVYVFTCEMPDDNQEILITTKNGYVEKDVCYQDDSFALDSGYDWIDDVLAWMPLPESYQPKEDKQK